MKVFCGVGEKKEFSDSPADSIFARRPRIRRVLHRSQNEDEEGERGEVKGDEREQG